MSQTEVAPSGEASLETQRRRQLMNAAIECVAEAGVAHTTMRMIADRAGVTTGMLLYYYRSKKDLISAAIATVNEEFSAQINLITDGTYGPRRLEAILAAFLGDPAEGVPRDFNVQYRSASLSDPDLRRTSFEQFLAARDKLGLSIRAGQEHGELRSDVDDMLAADLILVLMQGLAMEESLSPEVISRERALDIARLALSFLSAVSSNRATAYDAAAVSAKPPAPPARDTAAAIEAALLADPNLDRETARGLARAFSALYRIAARP